MEAKAQTEMRPLGTVLAQANLQRMRGQWNEAVETCVRVLREQPGNADAHSLLGDIYRDQGAVDDAIQWYRMAVDIRPDGPDVEKLRKLEQVRDSRAAGSAPLNPAVAPGPYESVPGGTAPLMGYSPKRWLNTLTVVSVCFLAATLLVLVVLRMNTSVRGAAVPRPMQLSSHPVMPTAETGTRLPSVNPNRPTVLPAGEHPEPAPKVHRTGEGLEPDRPGSSRTTPLPNFAQPAAETAKIRAAGPLRSGELPPAPVQIIVPVNTTFTSAPDGNPPADTNGTAATPRAGALELPGQSPNRDVTGERAPTQETDTERPASDNAGGTSSNSGGSPPER